MSLENSSMIQVKNNEIVIQGGDSLFFGIGAVALFMSGIGVYYTFCCISSLIEEFNYVDLSGLIFMLFWTAVVMSMAIYGFRTSIKKVTVNSEGVSIQILFIKNHYYWSEIKDFGLSYSGSTRGGRHYYDLYFAKEKQKTKNKYKKKLKGKMIGPTFSKKTITEQ